jgi:hypothetical protein
MRLLVVVTCLHFFLLLLQEAERLEPAEDPTGYTYIDYSEKRSLPISVPDYHYSEKAGERYVVMWNLCLTYFLLSEMCLFVYGVFKDAVTSLGYVASNNRMISE